jgi:hypothetical protein
MGPRTGLEAVVKRKKNFQPLPGLKSRIIQSVSKRSATEISRFVLSSCCLFSWLTNSLNSRYLFSFLTNSFSSYHLAGQKNSLILQNAKVHRKVHYTLSGTVSVNWTLRPVSLRFGLQFFSLLHLALEGCVTLRGFNENAFCFPRTCSIFSHHILNRTEQTQTMVQSSEICAHNNGPSVSTTAGN